MTYGCKCCHETFTLEDLREWRECDEPYYMFPLDRALICPDCYDDFHHLTLEEQFAVLRKMGDAEK